MRAAAMVAVAVLLAGCDTGDQEDSSASDSLLREYQPRYDAVRNLVTGFASRVPQASPTAPACDRTVDPAFAHVGDAQPLGDLSNAEFIMADRLATPDEEPRDGGSPTDYSKFSVVPGYLAHGLGISRLPTPLSTGQLMKFTGYSGFAAIVNTQDPPTRLKLLLDAGLGVRYLIAVRVVRYEPASPRPSGSVTVDAFVLDLAKGDIPCRFQATGTSSGVVVYDGSRPADILPNVYKDIQSDLAADVDDVLTRIHVRR